MIIYQEDRGFALEDRLCLSGPGLPSSLSLLGTIETASESTGEEA